jgi:uroporphyrinogen-III synthase
MNNNSLTTLITRPEHEGRVLAEKLALLDVQTYCQPLFDYHSNQCQKELSKILTNTHLPIIIFISAASVKFANKIQHISTWNYSKILAVGSATALALNELGLNAITPEDHHSEGLLKLSDLQSINKKDIIIVRGDGGREHLAETLHLKGAKTCYFEAYQRIWRQLPTNIAQHWRRNNINCIVITSNALLKTIVQLLPTSDEYWKHKCIWVVASERIALLAKELGLAHVVNAHGANDDAITNAIINYGTRL